MILTFLKPKKESQIKKLWLYLENAKPISHIVKFNLKKITRIINKVNPVIWPTVGQVKSIIGTLISCVDCDEKEWLRMIIFKRPSGRSV